MKYSLSLICLLLSLSTLATNVIKNSKVTDVTIYRSYAKETRMGSTLVPAGNSEIVITNITQYIDENSIQIGCKNGVKILSVSSKLNYIVDENGTSPDQVKIWQDSMVLLDKDLRYKAIQKESYNQELALLNANNKLGSTTESLKPSLLKELLELNRTKLSEVKKLIFDNDEQQAKLSKSITQLRNQLSESSSKTLGKPVREIILKVFSKNAVNSDFKCSYLVTAASWTPTYEMRCINTNQPLSLACRAKITQSTGFDWKDAHIKLSTANPNQNHNRPILYPIYVDFMQPDYYKKKMSRISTYGGKDESAAQPAAQPSSVNMMTNSMLDSRDKGFEDGMKLDENSVSIQEGEMMVEYELENDYDIESDGQEHIVAIQEISLPATYNYHAVPKIDNGTFLLARVTDWGKYNLLAGDATIFFDDMYVGKSYLNPNISSDTLLISLGRDEKINTKRLKLNDLCVTKKFSTKKKETKAFEIIIKNNKNIAIEMEVLDQYPIARTSDIDVSLEESSGAQITKEIGKLLWRVNLKPGESKVLKLIYTIKFDEGKMIQEKN